MSKDELFRRKLTAWLWRPWYDAFVSQEEGDAERKDWRSKAFEICGITPGEAERKLVEEVDAWIDDGEGFPPDGLRNAAVDFGAKPVFRHPLSGKEKEWSGGPLPAGGINTLRELALAVLRGVAKNAKDPESAFLTLWRNAPALLRTEEKKQVPKPAVCLGAFWDIVPAYPFAPFTTIWQRQAAAAALAAADCEPALLSFRIGGVQEFIGRSRTTEDYWAGSYLISYLTWHAAKVIADRLGPDAVIFPALHGQPLVDLWLCKDKKIPGVAAPSREQLSFATFPNGLLALVPHHDDKQARDFAEEVRNGFAGEWGELCKAVKRCLEGALEKTNGSWCEDSKYWEDLWKRQTDPRNVFELFWTVTPWRKEPREPYGDWFRRASREMEARKALRDFRSTPEPNIKCHQTGMEEALQTHEGYCRPKSDTFWEDCMAQLQGPLQFRFREKERLGAVSVVRRLAVRCYLKDKITGRMTFPSTSSVAVAPFLEHVCEVLKRSSDSKLADACGVFAAKLKDLLKELGHENEGKLADSPYPEVLLGRMPKDHTWDYFRQMDGAWWYEEVYEPESLKREYPKKKWGNGIEGKAKEAQQALKEVCKAAKGELTKVEPASYFAILMADGDEVGQWINGEKLGTWAQVHHPKVSAYWGQHDPRNASLLAHLALSQCLGNLPRYVAARAIETKFHGWLVYAGGDDMLAFVPAANLAGGMDEYAKAFSQDYVEDGENIILLAGEKFTVSAAALLLPHKDPMSGAVRETEALLEDQAKERYNRKSGVITVRRQSGQQTLAGAPWQPEDSGGFRPFRRVQELAEAFAGDKLSARFVAHVGQMRSALRDFHNPDELGRMLQALFNRAQGKEDGSQLLEGIGRLIEPYEQLRKIRHGKDDPELHPWLQIENLLLVSRFLGRWMIP